MSCIFATSGFQNSNQCLLYIAQSATRTLLGTRHNVMQKLAILPCYASPPNLKCLPLPLLEGMNGDIDVVMWVCPYTAAKVLCFGSVKSWSGGLSDVHSQLKTPTRVVKAEWETVR